MSSHNQKKSTHDPLNNSLNDLKAAFACVTSDMNGYLDTVEDLTRALQVCGKNPTRRNAETYFRSYKKLGLDEFIEVASREESISENELIRAFRQIDVNGDGFISYREFMDIFTQAGDQLSPNEVRKIMSDADLNGDKKINYREFSKLIIDTIDKAKQQARKQMRKLQNNDPLQFERRQNGSPRRMHNSTSRLDADTSLTSLRSSSRTNDGAPHSRLSFADGPHQQNHRHDDHFDDHDSSQLNNYRHRPSESDQDVSPGRRHARRERSRDRSRDSVSDKADRRERTSSKSSLSRAPFTDAAATAGKSAPLFELKLSAPSKVTDTFQEPKNFKKWCTKKTKGGFYYNEKLEAIVSNSFALDLHENATICFAIEPYKTSLHSNSNLMNMDMTLLIIKNNKRLKLQGLAENKLKSKWCTQVELTAGRYFLFPFTTGCHLKKRLVDFSKNAPQLFKEDLNNKRTLSRQFSDALGVIFDMCDLDSNGKLSKDELNLHTFLTANENLSDNDWRFVGEAVGLDKNQLTRDGFFKLYKIEAQRDDTDVEDISMRLANMGFNKSLTIDQSCPYYVSVSSETDNFDLLLGEIYKLKAAEPFLSQIIEAKGTAKRLGGVDGVAVLEYHNSHWCVLEVRNESDHAERLVELSYAKSDNCVSNQTEGALASSRSVRLPPMQSRVALFLSANNSNKEWVVRCAGALAATTTRASASSAAADTAAHASGHRGGKAMSSAHRMS